MALDTDSYVAYDTDEHFYYLTESGIVKYTGKTHIPTLWKNVEQRSKNIGRLLYNDYTHSIYNYKKLRYRNIDHIEYAVFNNAFGERDAIVRALTIMVNMADDMDLDIDIMNGEKDIPEIVRKPLRSAGLYFRGEYQGYVEEDVYREGY